MTPLIQINNLRNEYSENLLPYSSVINDATIINKTSGDAEYTLESYSFFNSNRSIKYFYNSNTTSGDTSTFNLGSNLIVNTDQEGNYLFSFRLANYQQALDYDVDFKVNIFVDAVLFETIEGTVNFLASEYLKYKTFSQNVSLDISSMSEVDFSFEITVPIAPTAIYPNYEFLIDAFKFELDNKFLGVPTPYSLPLPDQITGWQSIVNTSTTQVITADTETQIIFTGIEQENGGLDFMDNTGVITPLQENDTLTIDVAFSFVVPSGTANYFSFYIKIDGVIFRGLSVPMLRDTGAVQYFSQSFTLPVSSSFMGNSARCYIDSNVGITLSNRYISVARLHKAKI